MAHRKTMSYQIPNQPMYGWSLDKSGRPLPIMLAERGAHDYVCPICNGPMIARKGNINQHHYAHESLQSCTPEQVAEAIAGKWLVLSLGTLMVLGQPCFIRWTMGGQTHQVNLLKDITALVENKPTPYGLAEVALLLDPETIHAVIMLNLQGTVDAQTLAQFTANGIPVIILPADVFRSGNIDLTSLLEQAEVHGGWWLQEKPVDVPDLILQPEAIRRALLHAVSAPPFKFWSPLTTVGTQENILRVHQYMLWLPDHMWTMAVGGTRNHLSDTLDIIIQEWPLQDGSTVMLYHIRLKDERAVAIRRFMPGEYVHATIDAKFRTLRATAEQIAYELASA
jgi:hypothetical protein